MRCGATESLVVFLPFALACSLQVDDNTPSSNTSNPSSSNRAAGGSTNSGIPWNDSDGGATEPGLDSTSPSTGAATSTSTNNTSSDCTDCGPPYEAFYDNNRLSTIRITIAQQDLGSSSNWLDVLWSRWAHCEPYNPIRATFEYESDDGVGNVKLADVGMRLRGSMKRGTNLVQGLKLDFQKPFHAQTTSNATRRRFGDINRLNTLSLEPSHSTNAPPDVTHMVQCLGYRYMRDFDIPAPRCNHLRVYVQGQYYGLMENVEEADHGHYLLHHFGTSDGMLLEASPSGCGFDDAKADFAYYGAAFSDYANPAKYNLERGTQADAEASLFPMFQCADAAQTPDDQQFAACIQEWLDVDEWLRLVAAESVMQELESLAVVRNIYLYFRPEAGAPHGGRFVIYTWDLDTNFLYQACKPASCDLFTSVSASFTAFSGQRLPIVQRLLRVFKSQYCTRLADFNNNVFDPKAVEVMAVAINPGMVNEPNHTQSKWSNEVIRLRDWIQTHRQSVTTAISTACAGT